MPLLASLQKLTEVEEATRLAAPKLGIKSLLCEKLLVPAGLDDTAAVEHDEPIHGCDR